MKITHMALQTQDLKQQVRFWVSFFNDRIDERYRNKADPGLESYFVKIDKEITIESMTESGLIG